VSPARAPDRPDPDALLARLREQDARAARGRLKVFLGMCPGVGKTHAMLRAAQRARAEGMRLLLGVVETHSRPETAALLDGLPALPLREVHHRGALLHELDLPGLLAARPQLAVIDELAHTNAPGASHPKRWQDVVELLEAGIDVFTTLNIQHLESRADAVRQITGAPVHETVPDSLLDLADEVELIDLTVEGLRTRLREGKVYLGERARTAAENFFREENLNALRELALRYTAERVDRHLRGLRRGSVKETVWRSGERLLVAVGPSPFSTRLVRWTRRLAESQGAPWLAVHIASPSALRPEAQALLDQNLALARELGAELVLARGEDIRAALVRSALEYNATQIVVGKPRGARWLDLLSGGSLVDRLVRLGGNIDIHVVPAEPGAARRRWPELEPVLRSGPREYALAAGVVAAIAAAGILLPGRYYLAVGLVQLLGLLLLSLRVGRWPVLLAGIVGALAWNYLFIPPRFTFAIHRVEDALLFLTYFVVALVAGQLTARVRAKVTDEQARERRASALLRLTRALAEARTLDEGAFAALRQIDELFAAKSTLLLALDADATPEPHFAASATLDEKERSVARLAHQRRRPAGRFTDTLPSCAGFYLPLLRDDDSLGVLGVHVPPTASLTLEQRDLLDAFARQLALMVERDHLRVTQERERLLAESEKLHRALLDSVSHELRTPLAVITGSLEHLATDADPARRTVILHEARLAAARLNRLVANLLDQTRLECGALRPRPDWCDPRDLVNAALDAARETLEADAHPLTVDLPDDLPPIRADFALTEQALANLLLNAARHTPPGTPVFITAGIDRDGARAFFTVADRGPGLPPAMKDRLFQKFTRGDAAHAGGLGLGLSIVRGFIAAQGGEVVAGENPSGGAVFTLYLPHAAPEPPPAA
jgi:two-component system sensor histidine kinase KdpD